MIDIKTDKAFEEIIQNVTTEMLKKGTVEVGGNTYNIYRMTIIQEDWEAEFDGKLGDIILFKRSDVDGGSTQPQTIQPIQCENCGGGIDIVDDKSYIYHHSQKDERFLFNYKYRRYSKQGSIDELIELWNLGIAGYINSKKDTEHSRAYNTPQAVLKPIKKQKEEKPVKPKTKTKKK